MQVVINRRIDTSEFDTKSITTNKLTYLTQSGSFKVPLAGGYKTFPTAYTSSPQVIISPIEGSLSNFAVNRITAGSFSAYGSPGDNYFNWIAYGSA